MQRSLELVEYRVPKFMYSINVKNREKQQRKATFDNTTKLTVSDKDTSKGIVTIEINMNDEEGEIKYSAEIRGIFKFFDESATEEEKQDILKNEGFEKLYLKLDNVIKSLPEITGQKLPTLPELKDILPLE